MATHVAPNHMAKCREYYEMVRQTHETLKANSLSYLLIMQASTLASEIEHTKIHQLHVDPQIFLLMWVTKTANTSY